MYTKLFQDTPAGYHLLADSAFPHKMSMAGRIVTPLKEDVIPKIRHHEQRLMYMAIHRLVVTLRQAEEWGMRSYQGPFPRLKLPLSTNKLIRAMLFRVTIRLHNYR